MNDQRRNRLRLRQTELIRGHLRNTITGNQVIMATVKLSKL